LPAAVILIVTDQQNRGLTTHNAIQGENHEILGVGERPFFGHEASPIEY
jgi:hypothetical protein